MTCGTCGGGQPVNPYPGLTGVAVPPPNRPRRWLVTYPNGATQVFHEMWQVQQAVAISGGKWRELGPEEPHR